MTRAFGNGASQEAAKLARQFAATLEHLHDTWQLKYVSGAVATPAAEPAKPAAAPAKPVAAPAKPVAAPAKPVAAPAKPVAAPAKPAGPTKPAQAPVKIDLQAALRQQAETWSPATKLEYLRRKNVGDCRRCRLCQSRQSIVFGVGSAAASIMFVGEAPGADEDRAGEPFVGRAGQRLNAWLQTLGLAREQVYIANVLKCRPPENRDPRPDEVARCSPFLKAQIRAIDPVVIVALGRHAGMLLARCGDMSLRAMRQARLHYDASGGKDAPGSHQIPLLVTYHPAYVLRQESAGKGEQATEAVMQDLQRALSLVNSPKR